MRHLHFIVAVVAATMIFCYSTAQHAGARPPLPDDPEARVLFAAAEENRTQDGYLTLDEVDDVFSDFDINGDGNVTEPEMLAVWREKHLGDQERGKTLFKHADTDHNGVITRIPDLERVFYYFDRNLMFATTEQDKAFIIKVVKDVAHGQRKDAYFLKGQRGRKGE